MAKMKLELNKQGVRELLRSDEMMAVCQKYAYRAQGRLGEGYNVNYRKGRNRVNAEILAVTAKARQEANENSILKALGGSR